MRYFHRTPLPADQVLEEADRFFGGIWRESSRGVRNRVFKGTVGEIDVTVRAEGGHYTLVTVVTDQVGESEADKWAKRFLGMVHRRVEPTHQVRGAY
jgi:hypothetical protein